MADLTKLTTIVNCFINQIQPVLIPVLTTGTGGLGALNNVFFKNFCSTCAPALASLTSADTTSLISLASSAFPDLKLSNIQKNLLTNQTQISSLVRSVCVQNDASEYCFADFASANISLASASTDALAYACNSGCCMKEFGNAVDVAATLTGSAVTSADFANACNYSHLPPRCAFQTSDKFQAVVATVSLTGLSSIISSTTGTQLLPIFKAFKTAFAQVIKVPENAITITSSNSSAFVVTIRGVSDMDTGALYDLLKAFLASNSTTPFAALAAAVNVASVTADLLSVQKATVNATGTFITPTNPAGSDPTANSAVGSSALLAALATCVLAFSM